MHNNKKSQVMVSCPCIYIPASGGKPRVQNGVSGIFMDAVFEVVAQKEAEIYFIVLSSKAYYSSQVSRVCVAAL